MAVVTSTPFVDHVFNALSVFSEVNNKKPFNGKNEEKALNLDKEILKRKYIEKQSVKRIFVSRGRKFDNYGVSEGAILTSDMLKSDAWSTTVFKQKNFTVPDQLPQCGRLHPLVEMRTYFRKIFMKLGFTEMFTRRYVEASFWNFDALYQPQAHPCRDMHDTFFVASPFHASATSTSSSSSSFSPSDSSYYAPTDPAAFPDHALSQAIPVALMTRIRQVHEGHGDIPEKLINTQGLKYAWNINEGGKLIMRTHTTAVSARTLATLNEGLKRFWNYDTHTNTVNSFATGGVRVGGDVGVVGNAAAATTTSSSSSFTAPPMCKFFSIDRVFRNETLDRTHLAEFHQIEGFVVGPGLHVGHLMGVIKQFFGEIGLHKIRFQATYNPYTEPSLEIYAYHPTLKKDIEIGNSGIFREEVMLTLGLGKGVRAIAWGLSLERPAMIQTNTQEIQKLIGHNVDAEWVEKSTTRMMHP